VQEEAPHAPWALVGEGVVVLVRRRGQVLGALPTGLAPLPGPAVIVATRYDASPIGPFCQLDVLEPARFGARPGWSVTLSVVSDARARSAGRSNWGFPREVGSLVWDGSAGSVSLLWAERGLKLTADRRAGTLPFVVPVRLLQRRTDGPVAVPLRLRGLVRRAHISIEVPPGEDGLELVAGSHHGAVVAGQRLRMQAARHPAGFVHTLHAPLRPPEPGVAGAGLATVGALVRPGWPGRQRPRSPGPRREGRGSEGH
jgi:hypothetical protein